MKKILLSLLFSAALLFTAVPTLSAKAEEAPQVETGSFAVEVEEPVISASFEDMRKKPTAELNTAAFKVYDKAITIGGSTYIFADVSAGWDSMRIFYAYGEDGTAVLYGGRFTSESDKVDYVIFKFDAFTGSKNIMIAGYNNTDYELVAAKNATVSAMQWQGSSDLAIIHTVAGNTSYYARVYLPSSLAGKDVSVGLYDGSTQIGMMEIGSTSTSDYVYVNSLLNRERGYGISANSQVLCSGYIYVSRKLTEGRTYVLKATVGDSIYAIGEVRADGSPYIAGAFANGNYQGQRPVIYVNAYGYDFSGLSVELRDTKSGAAVATSNGGKKLQTSSNYMYYQLVTDKTLDELDRTSQICVSVNGITVYNGQTFSTSSGIADAYYNHVVNTVVARTYGIPDGTVVTAVRSGGYTAQGTVYGDIVGFQFSKNGVPAKLPNGTNNITYSFTLPGKESANSDSDSVQVYNQEDTVELNVNTLSNSYFYAGKSASFALTISKNNVSAASGNFTAVLKKSGSDVQVGGELPLTAEEITSDGAACWKLTGNFPAVAAGNYVLSFQRGTTSLTSYSVYVMDSDKVYGRIYSVNSTDGSSGAQIYIPYKLTLPDGSERYDRNLFALKVTDIVGNSSGISVTRRNVSSPSYVYYDFSNVDKNLIGVKVSAFYNGQPVYDISNIADNKACSIIMNPNENAFNVSFTSRSEKGRSYMIGVRPNKECVAYVVQVGTMNVVKKWEFAATDTFTYFTADMLSGLEHDNAAEAYNIYFYEKNGTGVSNGSSVYLGQYVGAPVANGIGYSDGAYYLYQDGVVNTAYTGLYLWNDKWVYIAAGKVDLEYTGLVFYNDAWWYVRGGYVDFDYTGLAFDPYVGWWCVVNGAVNFSYTGLVFDPYVGWWYVENGAVNFGYTGLIPNDFGWWYVENGGINLGYTGLAYDPYVGWWYVENGAVNFGYTGLVPNESGWWYVENGGINSGYTGLAYDPYVGWWYVQNGAVNFEATGLVCDLYGGWWYVENGGVNFGHTGLVNDPYLGWWYVENDAVNFGITGLVEYEGDWWYVENGTINFEYTGAVEGPDGVSYNVVNGVVVF